MKASLITAAALAGLASAGAPVRRANHDNLFKAGRRALVTGVGAASVDTVAEECDCYTIYTTWYGEPTLVFPTVVANTTSTKPIQVALVTPAPPLITTSVVAVPTTAAPTPTTVSKPVTVPTPAVETCPTPGVYIFPATTIVITETTTVCAATTTVLPPVIQTYGGVTTTVNPQVTTITQECETVVYPPGIYVKDEITVTVTVYDYVTVCPWVGPIATSRSTQAVAVPTTTTTTTTSAPAVVVPTTTSVPAVVVPPTSTSVPAVVVPTTSTSVPAVVVVSTSTSPPVVVVPTSPPVIVEAFVPSAVTSVVSSAVSSVVSSAASVVSSASSYPISGALFPGQQADHWAITYTPYTGDTGACKSKATVYADIKNIQNMGFTTLRLYSTDCDTLANVGGACEEYGIRMIIGIFIKEAGCGYSGEVQEQVETIISWGKFNIVDMIVIGNEAVFGGLCSASQLSSLITTVKSKFIPAGYTGPYSTAETVNIWQANGEILCSVIDIAGAQTHPYFNAETTPSTSGSFVKGQIDIVKSICGKPAISLECGWPTQGSCNGAACPGVPEQQEAMASVRDACGHEVVFFTYGEALWKSPGSCNCEPYFDITSIFGSLL